MLKLVDEVIFVELMSANTTLGGFSLESWGGSAMWQVTRLPMSRIFRVKGDIGQEPHSIVLKV